MAIRERNGVRVGLHVKDLDGNSLGRVTRLHESGFDMEKGLPLLFRQDFVATYDEVRGVKDGVLVLGRTKNAIFDLAGGTLPPNWRAAETPRPGFPTAATPREGSQLGTLVATKRG
jgi:hypothetical protein